MTTTTRTIDARYAPFTSLSAVLLLLLLIIMTSCVSPMRLYNGPEKPDEEITLRAPSGGFIINRVDEYDYVEGKWEFAVLPGDHEIEVSSQWCYSEGNLLSCFAHARPCKSKLRFSTRQGYEYQLLQFRNDEEVWIEVQEIPVNNVYLGMRDTDWPATAKCIGRHIAPKADAARD